MSNRLLSPSEEIALGLRDGLEDTLATEGIEAYEKMLKRLFPDEEPPRLAIPRKRFFVAAQKSIAP